jgi:hypothetical protein
MRAHLLYSGVCVGPKDSTESVTRAYFANKAEAPGLRCVPYANVTNTTFTDILPEGRLTLALACQQLARFSFDEVRIAAFMTLSVSVAVLLQVFRACQIVRTCSAGSVRRLFNVISVVSLAIVLIALGSSAFQAASLMALADNPSLMLAKSSSVWRQTEHYLGGSAPASVTARCAPKGWWGSVQVISVAIATVLLLIIEAVARSLLPEGVSPLCPCCDKSPRICCGDPERPGFCGDLKVKHRPSRMCAVLRYSTRQTTDSEVHSASVDGYRLCVCLPPTLGLLIASAVLGILLVDSPFFYYTAEADVYVPANSMAPVDEKVKFKYSLSFTRGCLESSSAILPSLGYLARDCFPSDAPRRLSLRPQPVNNTVMEVTDFSAEALVPAALLAAPSIPAVLFRAVGGGCVLLGFLLVTMCNAHRGTAFRWYRVWGRLVGIMALVCLIGDAATITIASESLDSISSLFFLAALKNAKRDQDDDYGVELRSLTNPLGGDARVNVAKADLNWGPGKSLAETTYMLSLWSLVFHCPIAFCGLCGTFRGGAPQTATVSAPPPPPPPTRRRPPTPTSRGLQERFGTLASISKASERERLQKEAERLSEQIRQVRQAGMPEDIISGLQENHPSKVRVRADELIQAIELSTPASTPALASSAPTVAVLVAPPAPEVIGHNPMHHLPAPGADPSLQGGFAL